MAEVGALSPYGLPFSEESTVPDKKLWKRTWPRPPQLPVVYVPSFSYGISRVERGTSQVLDQGSPMG